MRTAEEIKNDIQAKTNRFEEIKKEWPSHRLALIEEYLRANQKELVGKYAKAKSGCAFLVERVEESWEYGSSGLDLDISIVLIGTAINSKGEQGSKVKYRLSAVTISDEFIRSDSYSKTYSGQIEEILEGDVLSLDGEEPLADEIQDDIDCHGNMLTVRYWVSKEELTKEQLEESFLQTLCGCGEAEYEVRYSEITGYLYTTEELKVGGHDLLEELRSNVGSFLHMEIEFDF